MKLYVLIACEESQAECEAFRNLGHEAFSCDIQPCRRGGHSEWHIWGDCTELLQGRTHFHTMDGKLHRLPRWDLIICHPPCTYICKVSAVHMIRRTSTGSVVNPERYERMLEAVAFFRLCLNAKAHYIAVENPQPMARANLPRPSFYADPSWFGVKYTKKTLYWVKNLPPLMAEMEYSCPKCYTICSRSKYRSRTFPQMAKALAKQWSEYILNDICKNREK